MDNEAATLYEGDAKELVASLHAFGHEHRKSLPNKNDAQRSMSDGFSSVAEAIPGLVEQVDVLFELTARVANAGAPLAADDTASAAYDRRASDRLFKQLEEERKTTVEQMKLAVYSHRHVARLPARWLRAEPQRVSEFVDLVDQKESEAADGSLTPGRHNGMALPERDEDFDFEQLLRDIHLELIEHNREATTLPA